MVVVFMFEGIENYAYGNRDTKFLSLVYMTSYASHVLTGIDIEPIDTSFSKLPRDVTYRVYQHLQSRINRAKRLFGKEELVLKMLDHFNIWVLGPSDSERPV